MLVGGLRVESRHALLTAAAGAVGDVMAWLQPERRQYLQPYRTWYRLTRRSWYHNITSWYRHITRGSITSHMVPTHQVLKYPHPSRQNQM